MGYDSGIEVSNALIDMYGKCKCIGDALEIFEMMIEKDIYSWNSIMAVHEQCGDLDRTLRLFDRMLSAGVLPDLVTITTVLPVCSHLAALMHGREIHGYMIKNGLEKDVNEHVDDVQMTNAVMDMYAKCGSMRNAYMVFDEMRNKDVASWNIMIMGYGMHGYGSKALDMFSDMCEARIPLDDVTFVGVLSACSHAGLVREGREFLRQMKSKYGVVPTIEHYTCVVDMLGRAGHLQEAYELVLEMPIEANPVVWRALLAACRLHGNQDLAEVAAQKVNELDPGHCGNYVLMSNIYVANGRYEEVSEVRHTMRQQNVKKTPGCSWIELKNGVHAFITGDKAHPKANFIYAELDSLTARLREHGYVPHF
ncbi:pentatricopeptide repeat-containing protein [Prunus yedoensis var. nudiflora]|uniref:Pentatricopeptide repeat-containing protein n=1 Tax=Prunus yedoensis var. nudiflora TaxID=2094558 RepID=A0A314ULE9_PRUYE|nr:pentatricopeptide repeat-containing protein [Prunus yedoensis var. nudiflora]